MSGDKAIGGIWKCSVKPNATKVLGRGGLGDLDYLALCVPVPGVAAVEGAKGHV